MIEKRHFESLKIFSNRYIELLFEKLTQEELYAKFEEIVSKEGVRIID